MATSTIKRDEFLNTVDVSGLKMKFAINASGNPYIRWTEGTTNYQLLISQAGITYQKQVNGGAWDNIWTNH